MVNVYPYYQHTITHVSARQTTQDTVVKILLVHAQHGYVKMVVVVLSMV